MKRLLLCLTLISLVALAQAARIKDIATVAGVRANQLIGYGLVVGLDGTGDSASFTDQTFKNMINQFGIEIPEGANNRLRNVAAVALSAELPAFARPGQTIDVTVSSLGNADSLRGGTLLMTPLQGADGRTYAIAQGNVVVGGISVQGPDGDETVVNVPSVGRVPSGASVERAVASGFNQGDHLEFQLRNPDFTTARRMAEKINSFLGPNTASALDAGAVRVVAPRDPNQRVSFLSILENLEIEPAQQAAKVIFNSRTGTVVVGQNVTLRPVAVSHGNITVTIDNTLNVEQPEALADGETVVVPDTEVNIDEENNNMFLFGPTVTLSDLVEAVNRVGASPSDVMSILQALKQAGALDADLMVI